MTPIEETPDTPRALVADTIDDLLRHAVQSVLADGKRVAASRHGPNRELLGVVMLLRNPRARLSHTESRGRIFSALGELCWYLAGSNSGSHIRYYIPNYDGVGPNGRVHGGYGPRLFRWRRSRLRFLQRLSQVDVITKLLSKRPESRQAVIQLFDAGDISSVHLDVPCTCTLQFVVRDGLLGLITHMRSNDLMIGFVHDVFCFTMLQELVARSLGLELGPYRHMVGSLHLYDSNEQLANIFLEEGWQPTQSCMPAMPQGLPWPHVQAFLGAEARLRAGTPPTPEIGSELDPYWADLLRILGVFACTRHPTATSASIARELVRRVSSSVYKPFLVARLGQPPNAAPGTL